MGGPQWHQSDPLPVNWYDPTNSSFTSIGFDKHSRRDDQLSRFRGLGGEAKFSNGLFSVGGGAEGEKSLRQYHVQAENVRISMEFSAVSILRDKWKGN
jgi:hypothetical protein